MNKNIRQVFFLTTLLVLLVGISALSATDVSDNTTATQTIAQDTPSTSTQAASTVSDTTSKVVEDTQIATTSKAKSVAKENTQTSTKTTKTLKSTPKSIDITDSNFDTYFTSSGLSGVNNGDTLNLTSDVSRNDKSYIVDKAVNIKGNNYTINLNTNVASHKTAINFVSGASNSNVSYVHFHNTQVYVNTTSNITFDYVNVTVTGNNVGSGVGVFSIRDGSINITVNNSYFRTENNGGFSTLVLTYAKDCTINNNTIIGVGTVGNLLYLNTYGAKDNVNNITQNEYNVLSNNKITGPSTASWICYGITISGPHNRIINNTVNYTGAGITTIWAGSYVDENTTPDDTHNITYKGNEYINNTLLNGASFSTGYYSNVEGNSINGTANIASNSNVTHNTFYKNVTINGNTTFEYNVVYGTLIIKGDKNIVRFNNVTKIDNNGTNTTLFGNRIMSSNSVSKIKSLKSDREIIEITESNIANYFSYTSRGNGGYSINPLGTIKGNTIYYFNMNLNNDKIYAEDAFDSFQNVDIVGNPNMTHANLIFEVAATNMTIRDFNIYINSRVSDEPVIATHSWDYFSNMNIENVNITANGTVKSQYVTVLDTSSNMKNCTFNIGLNATQVDWESSMLPSYSGISVANGDSFINNTVNITEIGNDGTTNPTIFGIILRGNNQFTGNNITVNGTNWMYSVLGRGSGLNISDNNIVASSTNYTAGIYMEGASLHNNIVDNNNITLTAGNFEGNSDPAHTIPENVIYGITITNTGYQGSIPYTGSNVKNNSITNNKITANAYSIYAIEQYGGDNITIANNTLTLNGTTPMGIGVIGTYSNITNNNITVTGKDNITNEGTADYIKGATTGINVLYGSNNTITNNIINSSNNAGIIVNKESDDTVTYNTVRSLNNTYAVTVMEGSDNTTVTNNNLKSNGLKGDEAVFNNGTDNTVKDNGPNAVATTLGVDNITSVKVGNNITVTGKLVDETNTTVTGAVITVVSGNTTVNATTDANGSYVASIPTSNVGTFTVTLTYNGNDDYLPSNAIATFNVEKHDTVLTVEPIATVHSGKQITVTGKLVDENGNVLPSRQIHMVVENVTQMQITNNNGTFTKVIQVNNVGTYNITLTYDGNKEYEASNVTTTYTVTKANTTVTIDPINGVLGKEVSFTAHVTDENSQPVTGGYVIFKVNGVTLKDANNTPIQVNVTNGVAVLNTTATWSKAVNTTAAYSGSDNYNKARTDNGSITIAKQNATVSVTINENIKPGENLTAAVNVTDAEGNIVNAGTVIFKINGKTLKDENNQTIVYNVTNGSVTLNYTIPENYSAKTYTLTAVYGGSIYNRAETTQNFTLNKLDANIALNVTTDDLKPGSQIIAIATITDANGNPVTRGHVTFKLNNKTITDNDTRYVVDVTNGVATLNYTIPSNYSAKAYKLSAVFGGSNYNTNEAAQNITLSKIDTNIVTQNITITDNTLNVQATINNVETGNIANERTQKVSIKYDKHTVINSTVIENGVIDLNTTLTDVHAGEHTIEIVTSGNSIYNPNRVNATVTTQ